LAGYHQVTSQGAPILLTSRVALYPAAIARWTELAGPNWMPKGTSSGAPPSTHLRTPIPAGLAGENCLLQQLLPADLSPAKSSKNG